MSVVELLAPARDLACGIAAIDHGADAVYIGAARFGARQAAGNSVEDIAQLCAYAHQFNARVYVTLNTLLFDDEINATERLAWELYRAGADAFIVQDLAFLRMNLPPVPLHASTQMDNRSPEKTRWLYHHGFRQIVLARELSLQEIQSIHAAVPDAVLEVFCHGALCVSYSGRCNASQRCFGRSANRGACAQFCRLPFTLLDADGHELMHDKHLLSLRDMNRSEALEEMLDAGVRSFKIEGRLKDVAYVKNVTAYYRRRLDEIMARRPEYVSASMGSVEVTFQPDLARSFSRGYTDYFLHGRTDDMASINTPKSRGPMVGTVKEMRADHIVVVGTSVFHNGDGLCFFAADGQLQGFRINRAEGNHLYPTQMPNVRRGDTLWRSYDHQWQRTMEGETARRIVSLDWTLQETPDGFTLTAKREDGATVACSFPAEHQLARSAQDESIQQVLSKLGDTVYRARHIDIQFSHPWFIPRSLLAEWRRQVLQQGFAAKPSDTPLSQEDDTAHELNAHVLYSNRLAKDVIDDEGLEGEMAMELAAVCPDDDGRPLMICRYCILRELGRCQRQTNQKPLRQPLYLLSRDGRRFRLHFDCRRCLMSVTVS